MIARLAPYPRALKHFERLLCECRSGVAMVEFALVLPLFLSMVLVGLEITNYSVAHMRISQIALMVADNAARVRDSIDEVDVDEVMVGARIEGDSISFGTRGRVILSSLEPNGLASPNTGQKIRWQRCYGSKNVSSTYGDEGDGTTDDELEFGMGTTANRVSASSGSAIMFVEVVYDYQPLIAQGLLGGAATIRYSAAHVVRERDTQAITNFKAWTNTQKRVCSRYSST